MNMRVLVLFIATILVASQCHGSLYDTFPLQMKTGNGAQYSDEVRAASWRLGVEAHNVIDFETVPDSFAAPNSYYIVSGQYQSDCKLVNQQAYFYARTLTVRNNDIWVFSIDGTALSNIPYYSQHGYGTEVFNSSYNVELNTSVPYYSQHGYGTEVFNSTLYDEWVLNGDAPTLPETLKNYNKLLDLGFKVVFISGRTEDKREVTISNLKKAGFDSWHQLILKDPVKYNGQNALAYKSTERRKLEQNGYRIVGNIGDQWSDLHGYNYNKVRTFKLPNPLYYIP